MVCAAHEKPCAVPCHAGIPGQGTGGKRRADRGTVCGGRRQGIMFQCVLLQCSAERGNRLYDRGKQTRTGICARTCGRTCAGTHPGTRSTAGKLIAETAYLVYDISVLLALNFTTLKNLALMKHITIQFIIKHLMKMEKK